MSIQLTPELMAQIQAQLAAGGVAVAENPAEPLPVPAAVESPALTALVAGTKKASGFLAEVDFSDVADFVTIPEGTDCEAEIIKAELTTSAAGNEMLKLSLKVTFPSAYAGQIVLDNVMTANPKSFFRLKSLFRAADLLTADGLRIAAASEADLLHSVVRFRCKNEEYNGNIYNKVQGTFSPAFETPGLEG